MKYLLDTNVYLGAFRSAQRRAQFRQTFFPLLPTTFLSAVVAYELHVNVQDIRTRSLLQEFIRPMKRTGRVVSPTFDDWTEAASVVTTIWKRDRSWRSKLAVLLNDILIALCARKIGATLLTYNKNDFQLIRRHKDFSLRILETD